MIKKRHIHIKYEYKINENIYYGNKINLIDFQFTNKKYLNKILENYKIGNIVDVYYNPKNYIKCYLERGFNKIILISIGINLFIFLLFISIMNILMQDLI